MDDDAQCLEASPSFNGETYRWTCEACQNNSTVTQSDKNNSAMIQSGIGLLLIGLLGFQNSKSCIVSHNTSTTTLSPFAFSFTSHLYLIHSVFHEVDFFVIFILPNFCFGILLAVQSNNFPILFQLKFY